MKPQSVRLLDVFVFGPMLLTVGFQKTPLTRNQKTVLAAIGVGTIWYNLANYYRKSEGQNDN